MRIFLGSISIKPVLEKKLEELFVKEIAGPGAVRKTLQETLNK